MENTNTKLALVQTLNFLNNNKTNLKNYIDMSIDVEKEIEQIEPINDINDGSDTTLFDKVKNYRYPASFKKIMDDYSDDIEDIFMILDDDFDLYKENISIVKSNLKKDENIRTSKSEYTRYYQFYKEFNKKYIKKKLEYLETRENHFENIENYTMMLQIHRIITIVYKFKKISDYIEKSLEFTDNQNK